MWEENIGPPTGKPTKWINSASIDEISVKTQKCLLCERHKFLG